MVTVTTFCSARSAGGVGSADCQSGSKLPRSIEGDGLFPCFRPKASRARQAAAERCLYEGGNGRGGGAGAVARGVGGLV